MEPEGFHTQRSTHRSIAFVFSALLGFTGILLVLFNTAKYGVGVSGDSIDYLSTADNLIQSQRFVNYTNATYIHWPPLYPSLLAIFSLITGFDTFLVARVLNAANFGMIVFLTGILFLCTYPGETIWSILGALIAFTSLPILRLASNITSDPLFLVFILLFVLMGKRYLTKPGLSNLLTLAFIAGMSAILRWHGVALIMSLVVLSMYANRKNLKSAILTSLWAGAISSLPFLYWVFGRNYRLHGTLLGTRELDAINPLANIADSVEKFSNWILPDLISRHLPPMIMLAVVLLYLVISSRSRSLPKIIKRLTSIQNLPWVIFSVIYYPFITFTTFTADHFPSYDDRYYTPLFIFTFLGFAVIFNESILKPLDEWRRSRGYKINFSSILIIAMFGTWLIYPGYKMYKYIAVCREYGESTYNLYNTESFNKSKVIRFLLESGLDEEIPVYSNFPGAVYFFTRRITFPSPHSETNRNELNYLVSHYQEFPESGEAYLVFFLHNHWRHYYTPQQLSTIAELTEIFTSKHGSVYLVRKP